MNIIYEHLKNKFSKKLFTNTKTNDIIGLIKLAKSSICGDVIDYAMVEPILSQYGMLDEDKYIRVLLSNGNKEFANYAKWGYSIPEDATMVDFKNEKVDDVFNKWIFFAIESYEFEEIKSKEAESNRSKSIVIIRSIDQKQNLGPVESSYKFDGEAKNSLSISSINACGYKITVTNCTTWNDFIKRIGVISKFMLGG